MQGLSTQFPGGPYFDKRSINPLSKIFPGSMKIHPCNTRDKQSQEEIIIRKRGKTKAKHSRSDSIPLRKDLANSEILIPF